MSDEKPAVGQITWRDLTVPNAEHVRDFYCDVVGSAWTPHDLGEYDDYTINLPDSGETVTGICHARGPNANLPAQWLMYISDTDVGESARLCVEKGGEVLEGPRKMGTLDFCVIRDPAGAVAALISGE